MSERDKKCYVAKEEFVIMRPRAKGNSRYASDWCQANYNSRLGYRGGYSKSPAVFDTEEEARKVLKQMIVSREIDYKNVILVRRVIVHDVLDIALTSVSPYIVRDSWRDEHCNVDDFSEATMALNNVIEKIQKDRQEIETLKASLAEAGYKL